MLFGWNGHTMIASIKQNVVNWAMDVNRLISDELIDLDPHEYCVGAVLIIAIGFVMLRR